MNKDKDKYNAKNSISKSKAAKVGTSLLVLSTMLTPIVWDDVAASTNNAPIIKNNIGDIDLELGHVGHEVRLDDVFEDIDGDPFTISVSSESNGVVNVTPDLGKLTILPLKEGTSTVKLIADDGIDTTELEFLVNVKDEFTLTKSINNVRDLNGTMDITLSEYFSGASDYRVISSDTNIVNASITGDVLQLVEGSTPGVSSIRVEASHNGEVITLNFNVNVGIINEIQPIPLINIGSVGLEKEFDLTGYFDGDGVHTYELISNNDPHIVEVKSINGNKVIFKGLKKGLASISFKVTDEDGDTKLFNYSVNVSELEFINSFTNFDTSFSSQATKINLNDFVNQNGIQFKVTTDSKGVGVVSTEINANNELKITPLNKGVAVLTVEATNSVGEKISQNITVNVTVGPEKIVLLKPIKDILLTAEEKFEFDLNEHYSDTEGGKLTYTVKGFDTKVVDVNVSSTGKLTVTRKGLGKTTINLEVIDERGKKLVTDISVEVKDNSELASITLSKSTLEKFGDTLEIKGTLKGYLPKYTVQFKLGNATVEKSITTGTEFTHTFKAEEIGVGTFNKINMIVKNDTDKAKLLEKDVAISLIVKESAIKSTPVVKSKFNDLTLGANSIESFNLDDYFSDESKTELTYTVKSSNDNISAVISKSKLDLKVLKLGTSEITIEATNKFGNKVSQKFKVVSKNGVPDVKIKNIVDIVEVIKEGNKFKLRGTITDDDKDSIELTALLNGIVKNKKVDTKAGGDFEIEWDYAELKPGIYKEVKLYLDDSNSDKPIEKIVKINLEVKEKDKVIAPKPEVNKPTNDTVVKTPVKNPVVNKPTNSGNSNNTGSSNPDVKVTNKKYLAYGDSNDSTSVSDNNSGSVSKPISNEIQVTKTGLLLKSKIEQGQSPDFYIYYSGDNKNSLAGDYQLELFSLAPTDQTMKKIKSVSVKGAFNSSDYLQVTEQDFNEPGEYKFELVLSKNGSQVKSWNKELIVLPVEEEISFEDDITNDEEFTEPNTVIPNKDNGNSVNDIEEEPNKTLLYTGIGSGIVAALAGGFLFIRRRFFS